MIILLKPNAAKSDAEELLGKIAGCGLKPLYMPGTERTVLGAIGDERVLASLHLENYPCVEKISPVLTPYKLVSREAHSADSVIHIGRVPVGGSHFAMIAGPCAVESQEQMEKTANSVHSAGANILRGGAFKPRTSPYSFQGLGVEGLKILKSVSLQTGLPSVTEVVEVADVEAVDIYADAFQVGARNMQNFRLLKELGQSTKPVVLKRGMAAKLDDLLLAAEYIVSEGNPNVILCERGIRTFETATRNTLDLSAIPYLKQKSHLPVLADPSHATGVRELVVPMAKAAIIAGADGIMIEVHHNPKEALSDGQQSLPPDDFLEFMRGLPDLIRIAGKKLDG